MEKINRFARAAAIHQWDCVAIAVILSLAFLAWRFALPAVTGTYADAHKIVKSLSLIARGDSMMVISQALQKRANRLDSLLNAISDTVTVSEQAIPGVIYDIAAKAGIKTSKVEIGRRIALPDGVQIPVTLAAEGDYDVCGTFIEGVERLKPGARVRDLDIKKNERGQLSMYLDFVFLAQKQ